MADTVRRETVGGGAGAEGGAGAGRDGDDEAGRAGAMAHRADPGGDAVTDLGADALSRAIHAREVSCREVMRACLDRIGRHNPRHNAIVNLAPEDELLRQADERDRELAAGRSRGWLHGMPQAVKDASDVAGFPTTHGLALLADARPATDGLMAARMKAAGCIVVGKTNVPELTLGSHTYNALFGATRNAWDDAVSAGGSSGGAAVALALRLLPAADGSDFMGSLRNPAAWNNVYGLRPSAGRVPMWPARDVYIAQMATEGPMARSVLDLARLLAVQAGHDERVPLSLGDAPGTAFLDADAAAGGERAAAAARGLRVGWLGDLSGRLATEAGVLDACEDALGRYARAGAQVEPIALGFDADALWDCWLAWRRALTAPKVAAALQLPGATRESLRPVALWEHDEAQGLTAAGLMQASAVRSAFHAHLLGLFGRHDVLALPAAQVWPFPVGEHWPREIAGRAMDTYHRWMETTIYATLGGLPAISVPAGFDPTGRWPTGVQLIGRPRGDAALLRAAAAWEAAVAGDWLARRPPGA